MPSKPDIEQRYEELLAHVVERAAKADQTDAPLLMFQTVEDAMIVAGEIDPARGEHLEAFGINVDGKFERKVYKPKLAAFDRDKFQPGTVAIQLRLPPTAQHPAPIMLPVAARSSISAERPLTDLSPHLFVFYGPDDGRVTIEASRTRTAFRIVCSLDAPALLLRTSRAECRFLRSPSQDPYLIAFLASVDELTGDDLLIEFASAEPEVTLVELQLRP